MHIGHAKAAILNATAAMDYEGKFILRFDDTNPSKEKIEFEDAQLKDLHTLGCIPNTVSHTSDYFDEIEKKCIELIELGKAYCDNTSVEIVYPLPCDLTIDEETTYGWDCERFP